MEKTQKKIVCLGGGIGTVHLIKGLKAYTDNLSVIISMADDGGSTGRLRRLYNILPPGDLVSCMAALSPDEILSQILTYRFPGDRYGREQDLAGHKLGNLIMVAMRDVAGDFNKAIELFQKTFAIPGTFLPATVKSVTISATTKKGKEITTEQKIDLGQYEGKKELDRVRLLPEDAKTSDAVILALRSADAIIAGPGDLYTTILPTLIVPGIADVLLESKKEKIFVVNVANKPEETKGYSVLDYVKAVEKHLGAFPFQTIIVNSNVSNPIPSEWVKKYSYVSIPNSLEYGKVHFVQADVIDAAFPLYHDTQKLAKVVAEHI